MKQHCTVKANLSDVEIGMNRRTWTMLLNFFGALGQKPCEISKELASTSVVNDPVLEALLYGRRISSSEVENATKMLGAKKKKGSSSNDFKSLL
jgi:hypothetical protein